MTETHSYLKSEGFSFLHDFSALKKLKDNLTFFSFYYPYQIYYEYE